MKINTANLKTDGINALAVTGGMMGANAVSKLVPLENAVIRNAIPLAAGVAATLFTQNQAVKSVAYGAIAYGTLALVRSFVTSPEMPGGEEGSAGIGGIGENETVRKIVDMFIPNLGDTEGEIVAQSFNDDYEFAYEQPMVEDHGYAQSVNGNEYIPTGSAFDNLNGDGDVFDTLAGDLYDMDNDDPYNQASF